MRPSVGIVSVFIVVLTAFGTRHGIAQQVSYSGSVQYSTGSYYFTENTESLYLNNSVGLYGSNLSVYLNLPVITQSTPWVSYSTSGAGPLPTGGPRHGNVQENNGSTLQLFQQQRGRRRVDLGSADTLNVARTHVGDPSLSSSLKLYESRLGKTLIHGTLSLKIPVTDPYSGFGTGAWDAGAGFSWSQRLSDPYLWMVSGSYWQLGDMEELAFNNIVSYSTALARSFHEGAWMVVANFFGSTRMIDDVEPPVSVGGGIRYQVHHSVQLNSNILFGLTESAADVGVGFGWSVQLP